MEHNHMENASATETSHVSSAVSDISVTTAIFTFDGTRLRVLGLRSPSPNRLTLPRYQFSGGMSLNEAAQLSVRKNVDVTVSALHQVGAFTLSKNGQSNSWLEIGFMGVTSHTLEGAEAEGAEQNKQVWVSVDSLDSFDSGTQNFIRSAIQELRTRARFEDIAFALLPHEFSLSELQKMFESVMGRSIDVRNFRKKIDSLDILIESDHKPKGLAHRPPRLYSFSPERFVQRVASEGEIRFF